MMRSRKDLMSFRKSDNDCYFQVALVRQWERDRVAEHTASG